MHGFVMMKEADCLNVGVDPPGQVRITLEWMDALAD